MKVVLGKLNDELLINLALRAGPFCSRVDAAVAYADGSDHPLLRACKEQGLRMTFYGLLDDQGDAVGVPFLKELLSRGPSKAKVRLVKGHFHAKVIWWRGFGAYVGSANLTHKAWFNNVEAGVFFDEADLAADGTGDALDEMFEHLAEHSIPVTNEVVNKLERLAHERRPIHEHEAKLKAKFGQLFGLLPDNPGLTVKPAKGHKENKRLKRFATEWMQTLQLMRGLAKEFGSLGLRPSWVDADAHPAVHFDQFLHAYYYDYVRGGGGSNEEDDLAGAGNVEAFFNKHGANSGTALKEAARWCEERRLRATAGSSREHRGTSRSALQVALAAADANREDGARRAGVRTLGLEPVGHGATPLDRGLG